MKLWMKILIGMIAGVIFGLVAPTASLWIAPLGTLFLRGIKLLIVPLIFATLVSGMTSMKDLRTLGRMSLKTFMIYILTTMCAITIGLMAGLIFEPGAGMHLQVTGVQEAAKHQSLIDTLLNIVPTNPVAAMTNGHILQIICFAILLGISINIAGEKAEPVRKICDGLAETMYAMTNLVLSFAPIGVFALMAKLMTQYGMAAILPLLKVIGLAYGASLIHILLVYGGSIAAVAGLNPLKFFRGILDAQLVAFSTSSSSGTLPATMRCAEENLGVSKPIASFVLPLGATINMDGTAIYQGVCAIFIAQAYGVDLNMTAYMTIILTATLASIGTAGIPGAGLIMLSLILTSTNIPMEGLALIAGIDRILDMARTTVNISGDAMTSLLVAKSEKQLDTSIYNQASAKF
ncbi:dicarboxylate/amino acid:cation symporter [Desulfobaculum bizertense]|uniref:Na+/H+-dicarboxylate symporter n=1 Tax=Desulfobaculum bizertense DSM 18034 TaxID=1121442 RepID=A0A1T4WY76_9BACT|nr:dicarboxylate/amino acid:cation symporter [Desulfobaculum bizertense]SKA82276.1 Na+/H+-dicarboxylate symporter [Desulfobaculum bizertense DSM 18034]